MSTRLLYHAFGVRGYTLVSKTFEAGKPIYSLIVGLFVYPFQFDRLCRRHGHFHNQLLHLPDFHGFS